MAISVEWLDREQRIMLQTFDGLWSLDEYTVMVEKSIQMTQGIPDRIDFITDVSSVIIPGNALLLMPRIAKVTSRRDAINIGLHVIVGASTLIENMMGLYQNVFDRRAYTIRLLSTIEDALEEIRKDRLRSQI